MTPKQWATPNTMDAIAPRTPEGAFRQATGARAGRTAPSNLRGQVDSSVCAVYEAVLKQWATPRVSMAQDKQEDSGKCRLGEQAQNKTNKKLNPMWVAQLMNVPTDWVYPSESERNRTDELRMLGNGVVPQCAAKAFTVLLDDLRTAPMRH